jgi:hypothetical protein
VSEGSTRSTIDQRGRLVILVLYLGGLLLASFAALGTLLPPTNQRGLWFYAALAALLLGNLLVTPFFTKPADAISYGVAALVALLSVNPWGPGAISGFDRFIWSIAFGYVLVVLAAAVVAIAAKDSQRPIAQKIARSALLFADNAGSPRAVFSVVFLFALITYHRNASREYLVIGLAWIVFVGLRPLESMTSLWMRFRALWQAKADLARLGDVVRHDTPGLILIRETAETSASLGDVLLARSDDGRVGLAMALDHVGFADGCWLRAMHLTDAGFDGDALGNPSIERVVVDGAVFHASEAVIPDGVRQRAGDTKGRLLGFVAADTSIGHVQVEIVRTDVGLQEGSLLEVRIGSQKVLYQVIKGLTKEEVLHEKNTRGFVRAQAKKVGSWNTPRQGFDPVPWLPQPNEAVLLVRPDGGSAVVGAIGHFPGTSYPVSIDPHLLVTHNAAILGVLGVGKSFLGLELVERMLQAGIKVVCLDLTNQYARELGGFFDASVEQSVVAELEALGPPGKAKVSKNVEEGGSIREFSAKVKEQLQAFLKDDSGLKLRILNPVQFEVWRQDSKPYQGQASMATLTPTEITRIITEALLEVLQGQGMTDRARCCVVYEEAHSLIPEWNAVASEGDQTATNGTAKAILQGRKYGLGCLVITQRTANVTKSILNQCNTVFGLRVFDATGMEFLKNYVGEDYAAVLSTLEDRHAVVFGRASSCRDPVLARLNDRADFLKVFRQAAVGRAGKETTASPVQPTSQAADPE